MTNRKIEVVVTSLLGISLMALMAGCSKKAASYIQASAANGKIQQSKSVPTDSAAASIVAASVASGDLSDTTKTSGIDIKRLKLGDVTFDPFDPKPKGAEGEQPATLVSTLCGPRISKSALSALGNSAYPFILSSNSQVELRRDTSYQFGDGSNASSLAPLVIVTCEGDTTNAKNADDLSENDSSANVQIKQLKVGAVTMETIDPNLKGAKTSSRQSGILTLIICVPRITDSNLKEFKGPAYPIVLTAGSQLAIKRDTKYQFGDGSNASKAKPEVVINCEN